MNFPHLPQTVYFVWHEGQQSLLQTVSMRICKRARGNQYTTCRRLSDGSLVDANNFEHRGGYTVAREEYRKAGFKLVTKREFDRGKEL